MAMLTAFPGQLQTLIVRAGLNLCTIFNVHDTEAIAPLLERCSTVRHLELEVGQPFFCCDPESQVLSEASHHLCPCIRASWKMESEAVWRTTA